VPTRIVAIRGDITTVHVDAIVNAANEALLVGGGVDGAIHDAAGPELLAACLAIPEVRPGVRCPTGEARVTPAFRLPVQYVIHAVGPFFRGRPEDPVLLASAFRAALRRAEEKGCSSVAVPAISCGAFGYPVPAAARISAEVSHERTWALAEIRFVLLSRDVHAAWRAALTRGRPP
jgi:O-acetyl-ADP-ribose deacetylase (regulator of RNase III)